MQNFESVISEADKCREIGAFMFNNKNLTEEDRDRGLELVIKAAEMGDPESYYLIGTWLLEGRLIGKKKGNPFGLLYYAAVNGYLPARTVLDNICKIRSDSVKNNSMTEYKGPLVDFNKRKIKINCKGMMTPVDAKLEHIDGKNILTLSINVIYVDEHLEYDRPKEFYEAVSQGFKAWEGEYEVFCGQKIEIKVNVTKEARPFDNVTVFIMTNSLRKSVMEISQKIGTEKAKERVSSIFKSKRSFAAFGIKNWSKYSRKFIVLQSESGDFNEYEEIKHVIKHEFGHILGLGDLYFSPEDKLDGVAQGAFPETDSYYISDKFYNLVMCDHHGPISNNDIEMVLLAFSKNKMQNYQKMRFGKQISEALGKGN